MFTYLNVEYDKYNMIAPNLFDLFVRAWEESKRREERGEERGEEKKRKKKKEKRKKKKEKREKKKEKKEKKLGFHGR